MTLKQFKKIEADFNAEQKRWESLKIGDHIFETDARDYNSYFEIVIKEINIDERFIIGNDLSQNGKEVKLSWFWTKEELNGK